MLTNAAVKAARPRAAAYKLADERGLHLYVAPTGLRSFRLRCRHDGREQLLTIGSYPDIGLDQAREWRDAVRADIARGVHPAHAIRAARSADAPATATFETLARAWHDQRRLRWTDVHAADVLASLERDVFPRIGAAAIGDIDARNVLDVVRRVERRGAAETARRLRQRISMVFRYAIARKLVDVDPAALVRDELAPPAPVRRQPALTDIDDARALLDAADRAAGAPIVKLASRFLALTAVRLAAVRGARWDEIEGIDWTDPALSAIATPPGGQKSPTPAAGTPHGPSVRTANDPRLKSSAIWRVPAARMKMARAKKVDAAHDHIVPLSPAAIAVLIEARQLGHGAGLIFGGRDFGASIGEGAIGALYDRAGFAGRHVPHGWRATFATILNERWPEERVAIDRALAHAAKDKVEAAYNRAAHLARRRSLFDRWGELLVD